MYKESNGNITCLPDHKSVIVINIAFIRIILSLNRLT